MIDADVATECQIHHAIVCPVFAAIQADSGPMAETVDFWQNTGDEVRNAGGCE
jgi:hypothetical protein